MLTVQQAADQLGISKRTMYELAAPNGPIPAQRIGRTVRFAESDITEYQQSCRYTSTKTPTVGASHLTVSSPDGESGLRNYFRKAGHALKPRTSNKKKQTGSSRLQLLRIT